MEFQKQFDSLIRNGVLILRACT